MNSSVIGREVVIVEAVRTPVGRGHRKKGVHRELTASGLLARTLSALVERSEVPATEIDEVICGCVIQLGEQGTNVGRNAWLEAGLPVETPATTIDRQCGSAQQAVNYATAMIASGAHDVIVACGVEHMGRLGFGAAAAVQERYGSPYSPELLERYDLVPQGLSAELIAERWEIPRSELDQLALESHRRAHRATEEGRFEREIVPIENNGTRIEHDQGIRPDTTLEALARLDPVFKADGRITAGTSSQISDGAAAVLLMSADKARALGLTLRARIIDHTAVGVDPVIMLTGPIPATRKLLARNGMRMRDVDQTEVNEAFAPVVAAWQRELDADMETVNVNGGAMAIGHPIGSTGARLITTLLHELERSDREIGLVTMCCGGGIGTGTLIQRV